MGRKRGETLGPRLNNALLLLTRRRRSRRRRRRRRRGRKRRTEKRRREIAGHPISWKYLACKKKVFKT